MYSIKILRKARTSITATLAAAAISCFSLNLIPYVYGMEEEAGRIVAYIVAAVFWVGLLAVFAAAYATRRILYSYREKQMIREYIRTHRCPGIISFSKDRRMLILYAVTAAGLAVMAADLIFSLVPELVMFPILSVTIFLFTAHCVFDGKCYKAYKQIKESVSNETNP